MFTVYYFVSGRTWDIPGSFPTLDAAMAAGIGKFEWGANAVEIWGESKIAPVKIMFPEDYV